ncbi:MAG: DNA mismatch repair protein MutS [Paludibacteraceae bacterium]|nr:DNA mismatch repair protein MutS [Paludibacteraceae bacterium]
MAEKSETPLMRQYSEYKSQYPDAVLLFRVGDFYETFGDDAIKASEALGITLTKRNNGGGSGEMPLAGFPHHALDTYLPKLVRHGYRVAICDQLEDPKQAKGLVKRGITELSTPGVTMSENILDPRENNFLCAVCRSKDKKTGDIYGVSFLDISTGEYLLSQGKQDYVDKLLSVYTPKEILIERGCRRDFEDSFSKHYLVNELDDWAFTPDSARGKLLAHFNTSSLKGFGVENLQVGQVAAGAILHYLDYTQHKNISHVNSIRRIEEEKYVWMDRFTVRNLELFPTSDENQRSLLGIINETMTPMGSRQMMRWLAQPLKEVTPIVERHEIVETLFQEKQLRELLNECLPQIGDMERIVSKIAAKRANPRDVLALCSALKMVGPIKIACSQSSNVNLQGMAERLNPCEHICAKIDSMIVPNPPALLSKGGVIAPGYNEDLDSWRQISTNSKDVLLKIQDEEMERTGISSLKVGYNNVFGYYLEVRNTHKDKVPQEWIRKQTLTGAERYITPELKELEAKITKAEEMIIPLETRLFMELIDELADYISPVQTDTSIIAQLDCLMSFVSVSEKYKYVRPVVDDSLVIDIREGRHPVIERQLPIDSPYIANSVELDNEKKQIMMITGPNMAGKSALLRQTALIVVLAQIGCFVPADSAHIGVVDKIFTRVGASDNISMGESTFMVEMTEASSIINNITDRSLVLFDELGRGTSTYDGISIAWAIVEYLHENPKANPKTLFATHYHELNEMENTFERVKNYNVSVREADGKVIFLRKLKEGGSEHSFGIHVAKLAGMPSTVVDRANEILHRLEEQHKDTDVTTEKIKKATEPKLPAGTQLSIFQLDDPTLSQVRDEILTIDIDNLTPIEALNKLHEVKKILLGKS